jgi:arylsulfatase A-like enzyme
MLVLGQAVAPDIVLVSVDTLRPDHLGCYGYPRATSPNLDAFAREALLFEDVLCEVPLTFPSFGSMMTSRPPRSTGTTRNGLRMPGDVPTVAESFQAAGYQTLCVQSNWTLKAGLCALDRGFEVYDDAFHTKRWGLIIPERLGDRVADVALDLLKKRDMRRPMFLWVHFSDPHAPYRKHKDLRFDASEYRDSDGGKLSHKIRKMRARYDGEIAYTDRQIQRLLDALDLSRTAVVFTGDHGESLGEHDYTGHGRRVYQAGLQIPLIIRAPGVEAGRSKIPARGMDIAPTLLGLAGLTPASGMQGTDVLRNPPSPDRVRVFETYGGAVPGIPGAKSVMADRRPQWQGVVAGGWKLITEGDRAELYNLQDDPMERSIVREEQKERVLGLLERIREWEKQTHRGKADSRKLDKDDIQALESLGYVN